MGVSTDGEISFGVQFEEGFEFPWSSEDDEDIEGWWRQESGFVPAAENPFTPDGKYAPGFAEGDPRIKIFFAEQEAWDSTHPLPVQLVNYCSGDCPAYILAVPGSVRVAHRGYPEAFKPEELMVSATDVEALLAFCRRYDLPLGETEPSWYLSSYYG